LHAKLENMLNLFESYTEVVQTTSSAPPLKKTHNMRFFNLARHGARYRNLLEDEQRAYLAAEYQAGILWDYTAD